MRCVKLLGQRLTARASDRQVTESPVRVAFPNGATGLALPVARLSG
jgi:hypothetical protein